MAITLSRSLPAALTLRAKIVLACEREPSNAVVATRLSVGPHTIGKWRNRFITDRIEGFYDEMRSGRPRTVEDEAIAELITKTLARKPKAATHWSVRAIAKEANVPAQLDVHLVDNYAIHKHPKVRAWLARRPRWHIHFTPTYASWLNQVERFFAAQRHSLNSWLVKMRRAIEVSDSQTRTLALVLQKPTATPGPM